MSISNDLEKRYRKSGDDDLADAVSALLGTDLQGTTRKACISLAVDYSWVQGEDYSGLCGDIYVLLKNQKKISADLEHEFSIDSTEFFSELVALKRKCC